MFGNNITAVNIKQLFRMLFLRQLSDLEIPERELLCHLSL